MSKYIPGNQKHLTIEDRIYIQNELDKGTSFKDIARFLCKDPTTISKEVKLKENVYFASLNLSPEKWAEKALSLYDKDRNTDNTPIEEAGFDIKQTVKEYEKMISGIL